MSAHELIDALLEDRVLVYGSPPPDGRDLDLLVREPEQRAIDAGLADAGFDRRGRECVLFASGSAEIVELTSAASWRLPPDELDRLFADALKIDGLENLVRPSPHHTLLILARRVAGGDGLLSDKLRQRLEQALVEDRQAWASARRRADHWGARTALEALDETWRTGAPMPRSRRRAARRERLGDRATRRGSSPAARLRAAARGLPRPHRGVVVALSGLDGAGKSSQAIALCDTLERLGYDATVVRTRISWDDALWRVARPLKRLLAPPLTLLAALLPVPPVRERPVARERQDGGEGEATSSQTRPAEDAVTRVREASPLLTDLWTLVITVANASSQWKLMRRHLLRGGIVVCDRYTLDSIVELRYTYGRERSLRATRAALSRLYPRPLRAYLLDVRPETALERKGEWGIEWLSAHRHLYLEERERLGVRLLDGEHTQADLCAEVARDVWLSGV
ncbi:MAG: Thymidylate kinaselike protein [Solirubrobacterales bacterium]|nr:Thymidylate kinaselike protein [Solirubrobacterales bacterium]